MVCTTGVKSRIGSKGTFPDERIDDDRARGRHQQRVTVRRRAGGHLGADRAACAGPVVDDDRLAPRFGELGSYQARDRRRAAARRERRYEPDRLDGIGCSAPCSAPLAPKPAPYSATASAPRSDYCSPDTFPPRYGVSRRPLDFRTRYSSILRVTGL